MQLTQTILVIVLIIIGIILFVVLLVELVDIPSPLVVPFADGSIVKIKSLANNLYLRPISCVDIPTCGAVKSICDSFPYSTGVIISPIGQANDPLTNWQLCQYSSLSDTGQAKYLIYSENNQNPLYMTVNNNLLVLATANNICTALKSVTIDCSGTYPNIINQSYFSFILNERSQSAFNTTSGTYTMYAQCSPFSNSFIFTTAFGATSLPANICPPLLSYSILQTDACPGPEGDPRCNLGYLFSIEVQS